MTQPKLNWPDTRVVSHDFVIHAKVISSDKTNRIRYQDPREQTLVLSRHVSWPFPLAWGARLHDTRGCFPRRRPSFPLQFALLIRSARNQGSNQIPLLMTSVYVWFIRVPLRAAPFPPNPGIRERFRSSCVAISVTFNSYMAKK